MTVPVASTFGHRCSSGKPDDLYLCLNKMWEAGALTTAFVTRTRETIFLTARRCVCARVTVLCQIVFSSQLLTSIVNRAEANIFWYILPLFHSKKEILMTYSWILNFPCLTSIDKSYLTFLCQSYWKFCSSNQTCIILHESYIARLYDTAVAYCQSSSRPTTFFFFCIYLQRKKSTALCPGVFVYTAVYL